MEQQWYEALPLENMTTITPVSGGDVNQAYRVETVKETYFLLVQAQQSADFYAAEIAGLKAFEQAGITAPRVIANGCIDGDAYLLLSYLEEGITGSQKVLGRCVAQLHQVMSPNGQFGFEQPYRGSAISFDNHWQTSWHDLFLHQRIQPLIQRVEAEALWSTRDASNFEQVYDIMSQTLKAHKSEPSLLHGDLWAGNYMFLTDGTPALFDPSPLYGDREFDLGATKVFGGFDRDFYTAYDKTYPLQEGAAFRIRFYELYLLLVHLVKFGTVYLPAVREKMEGIINEKS
ncbi:MULTISPECIES: fructosamine kinase family protein [unclassified Staphylococcus]|uniref:fructosamine kinase family protein n=1 Tax=unclassified Staphylococcus TaxID=91994 RepID=UPI0021CFEA1D|nr:MULTISPECIES: fructosamine kinase family protein [unclassified Staphylococcus]UXR69464.1 fructosamine kinase family protein [Staphylococcus sp. IVB6246]UXR71519.1 fructosamine kinase family protein [Staphylococcus sp. IVB6240]UXR73796.1 fructosamine kinase family protein [Staphylococcus sp. IVB6238]UXR76116.1 fructosamine kinase family protein [Staphylococcus sp. IVB6233]UXR80313.1 fructosamine kinase family protein [Staphylococcus sp. IVB6218]